MTGFLKSDVDVGDEICDGSRAASAATKQTLQCAAKEMILAKEAWNLE